MRLRAAAASLEQRRTGGYCLLVKVIVTCGPSYVAIDQVRRITNFSTGELGVRLAESCAAAGCEVFCFKGEAATSPDPSASVQVRRFSTNDDLLTQLREFEERGSLAYFFHAAALADFELRAIEDAAGRALRAGKLPSGNDVIVKLQSAPKIIRVLRDLFPHAWIAGWKYQVDGGRDAAIAEGVRQIAENATNACFVNGPAYGEGFGQVERSGFLKHHADKSALCEAIALMVRSSGPIAATSIRPTARAIAP